MNSKYIKIIPALFFIFAGTAFAQYEKINAGILPSTWYSEVNILENQNVKVFAGIQNHSSSSFSFKGSFFIDNAEIYKADGISKPDSLVEVSAPWKTIFGSHNVQFKITEASINLDSLLAKESNSNNIFAAKNLSTNALLDVAKDAVASATDSFVQKIDDTVNNFADTIANKVLGLKQASSSDGQVLGTSTKYQAPSFLNNILKNNTVSSVWNLILDFLSHIIRSWKISLIVIIAIVLLIKFMF